MKREEVGRERIERESTVGTVERYSINIFNNNVIGRGETPEIPNKFRCDESNFLFRVTNYNREPCTNRTLSAVN
jgi:hypothetical protein